MAKAHDKERVLKAAREKQIVTYKGTPIRLSAETLQPRREWQEIFEALKGKNMQSRRFYPARISCKIEGEINFFLMNKSKKSTAIQNPFSKNIERTSPHRKKKKKKKKRGRIRMEETTIRKQSLK